MKIGLIIYGSLETLSGGYLYDRHLVGYLRANGDQVDILSLPWRSYDKHLLDNVRLRWAQTIAEANYDIILQDELNHPSLFLLNQFLRRICRCPIFSIVHHLRSSEAHAADLMPIYRWVETRYLRSVDGFIFNSETTRRIVQQQTHLQKPNVVVLPAADHRNPPLRQAILERIKTKVIASSPLQLLFIGNLMARKALHTVLNALSRLTITHWHLHVVGSHDVDPAYSAAMRHRANTLALTPHITWHGRVTDDALAKLLLSCHMLTMPSYEGFGIVYLEAMAYGLPVVAANVGAAPEIIAHQVNGFLIPDNDDAAMANYLQQLEANRVHLATLSYHARQRYEQHPTWQQSMDHAYRWLHEFNGKFYNNLHNRG